jgi:hypothetical protein
VKGDLHYAAYLTWIAGYVTSFNIYVKGQTDVTRDTDVDGVLGWIKNYCLNHPTISFATAADAALTFILRETIQREVDKTIDGAFKDSNKSKELPSGTKPPPPAPCPSQPDPADLPDWMKGGKFARELPSEPEATPEAPITGDTHCR